MSRAGPVGVKYPRVLIARFFGLRSFGVVPVLASSVAGGFSGGQLGSGVIAAGGRSEPLASEDYAFDVSRKEFNALNCHSATSRILGNARSKRQAKKKRALASALRTA